MQEQGGSTGCQSTSHRQTCPCSLTPSTQHSPGALAGLKVEKQDLAPEQGVPEERQAPTTKALFEETSKFDDLAVIRPSYL